MLLFSAKQCWHEMCTQNLKSGRTSSLNCTSQCHFQHSNCSIIFISIFM